MKRALFLGLGSVFILSVFIVGCLLPAMKDKPQPVSGLPSTPERTPKYKHDGRIIARASLHNHTIYSDGCRPADDLLAMAEAQGMSILAYNDHREGKVCYGDFICIDSGGVESTGYDEYYEHLGRIQDDAVSRGMIVLKGVEVSPPYFRNHGKFPNLVLIGKVDHFTVYNVEDTEILKNMPTRDKVPLTPEDEYHKRPLKKFVNYIHDNGGIVHCVHPEWAPDRWYGPVHELNQKPLYNVTFDNITSFASLPEGWKIVPRPGGIWDSVLTDYIAGMRDRPLWTSADADYHCGGSLAIATTLFYMDEFTEDEVYKCMREGRMVALMGEAFQDSYVAEWWAGDDMTPRRQVMLGEEVRIDKSPTVRFSLDRKVEDCTTLLVRNGTVVKEVSGTELTFHDTEWKPEDGPAYYRVEVIGPVADTEPWKAPTMPESELFVNPVFVRWAAK